MPSCGNSHLTVVAPAGTISLLAGNVSSGVEPIFEFEANRRVLDRAGHGVEFAVEDHAVRLWRSLRGEEPLPEAFVTSHELSPDAHLAMQAALQPWVDGAISKTIHLPADAPRSALAGVFERAHALGLKGCTVYRAGTARGEVVSAAGDGGLRPTREVERCCAVS